MITSLLAITALTLAVSTVRAQEEEAASPSPAMDEQSTPAVETSSPAVESAPVTMPEKAAATATPAKKEQPASSASPSAEKKKATPAEGATKAASSAADTGSPEGNVKRLEGEWENSVMKHDLSFIQARVAEDFIGCSSKGKRLNKATLVKEMKGDSDTYTSAKNGSLMVRAYGSNVAAATGTSKETGKSKDGKAFSRTYAWTDTWMLRGSRWQCVASQAMLVSGK